MTTAAKTSARDRSYDVVLYGATGFVGRQTVAYFAEHGKGLRWALAGRSRDKLEALRVVCGEGAKHAGVIVADADDEAALDALASEARVVLSTAGPFALYGSKLVAACVRHRTHYVDITGETPWVRELIDLHHTQAVRDGTRIIPCCGFDSVPSDIGALLLTRAAQERFGEPCVTVKACFSIRGGLNGGTLASALNLMETGQARALADPYLLNPEGSRPPANANDEDPIAPHRDELFNAWVGPFVMAAVNTRVVRRSAALLGYGPEFSYQEYQHFGSGAMAAIGAASVSLGTGFVNIALGFGAARKLLKSVAPAPGTGPSEATMDGGSFRCELVGETASGHLLRARITDHGDPGNRATTKMVCESALALANSDQDLPGGERRGGVLTPASGLGEALVKRLRRTGMTLVVD